MNFPFNFMLHDARLKCKYQSILLRIIEIIQFEFRGSFPQRVLKTGQVR